MYTVVNIAEFNCNVLVSATYTNTNTVLWRDLTKVIFILYYRAPETDKSQRGNRTRASAEGGERSNKELFE
jgi:hypothetical protein